VNVARLFGLLFVTAVFSLLFLSYLYNFGSVLVHIYVGIIGCCAVFVLSYFLPCLVFDTFSYLAINCFNLKFCSLLGDMNYYVFRHL
jgi:hypothetical protein